MNFTSNLTNEYTVLVSMEFELLEDSRNVGTCSYNISFSLFFFLLIFKCFKIKTAY